MLGGPDIQTFTSKLGDRGLSCQAFIDPTAAQGSGVPLQASQPWLAEQTCAHAPSMLVIWSDDIHSNKPSDTKCATSSEAVIAQSPCADRGCMCMPPVCRHLTATQEQGRFMAEGWCIRERSLVELCRCCSHKSSKGARRPSAPVLNWLLMHVDCCSGILQCLGMWFAGA